MPGSRMGRRLISLSPAFSGGQFSPCAGLSSCPDIEAHVAPAAPKAASRPSQTATIRPRSPTHPAACYSTDSGCAPPTPTATPFRPSDSSTIVPQTVPESGPIVRATHEYGGTALPQTLSRSGPIVRVTHEYHSRARSWRHSHRGRRASQAVFPPPGPRQRLTRASGKADLPLYCLARIEGKTQADA